MTRREAISNLKTLLKKINADSRLTNKQYDSIIQKHTNWMMEEQSETFKLARRNKIYQNYKCAKVIDVPKIDPCCGITSKVTIKRTKNKIPELYEDSVGVMIKSVTSIDGSTEIDGCTILSYPQKKNSPWIPKTDRFWFFSDGYLYGDLPNSINVLGLFKYEVTDCDSSKRFLDKEWIVSEKIEARVLDAAFKEIASTLQIPSQEKIDKNENK